MNNFPVPNEELYNAATVGTQIALYVDRFNRQIELLDNLQDRITNPEVLARSHYVMAISVYATNALAQKTQPGFVPHTPKRAVDATWLKTHERNIKNPFQLYMTLTAQLMAIADHLLPYFGPEDAIIEELYANAYRMYVEWGERTQSGRKQQAVAA